MTFVAYRGHRPSRQTAERGQKGGAGRAFAFGLVLAVGLGSAQGGPVLHEPVAAPKLRCEGLTCRSDGASPEALPEAVLSGEGLIAAPTPRGAPAANEQIYTPPSSTENPLARGAPAPGTDPPPMRRSRMLPDAQTGPEPPGERLYHEVFNPAVFPYKRMTALDSVDPDGALTIEVPGLRPLPVGDGRVIPGRDPFYGSVVIDFESEKPVPLPTPAAGIRLLSYKSTPPRTLAFYLDGAENLYVSSSVRGRHRLVYLVDAAPTYFAGALWSRSERKPTLGEVPRALVPALPGRWRREATRVLRHIGVRTGPGEDYQEVLSRLVGYFRAFQMGELDEGGRESLYLRISLSQRGVCRHRGYAFVITALQAGIPARYVENELHVFVEVFVPHGSGGMWRRINLGGAPLQQRVVEGESKVAYREKGGDPFERPPAFQSGVAPSVKGLPKRAPGESGGEKGGARDGALPALDGPEDRARRGETGSRNPADPQKGGGPSSGNPGTGNSGNSGGATNTGGNNPGGGNSGSGPGGGNPPGPNGGKGPGPGGTSGSRPGDGPGSGSGREGAGLGDNGDEDPAAPDLPGEDDIAQGDDRRHEPSSGSLIPTRISVALATAPSRIYRGTSIPIRGTVTTPRGSAAGLEVLILLSTPEGVRQIGRAFTGADGSFQSDVEIPGGVPFGRFPLIARVRGDDTRRGSSTAGYTRAPDR